MPDATQGAAVVEARQPEAAVPSAVTRPWGPTPPQERIALIDVLRGVALFGIVAANMRGFAGPHYAYFRPEALWQTRLDFWVQAFVDVFIQGKFISIFAFLFGLGFALQFSRAEAIGARFVPVYRRRLFGLILIGLLHQLLFWWGDVLVTYGLGGFLLILFRKRKNKTILIWALVLMLLPFAGGLGYFAYRHWRPVSAEKVEANKKEAQRTRHEREDAMRQTIRVYQTGSYAAIYNERLGELWRQNRTQLFSVVMTLPLFMFGLLVYRKGVFQHPEMHRATLYKTLIVGAAAGLPANVAGTYILHISGGTPADGIPGGLQMFAFFLLTFGRPLLGMSYVSAVVLLFLDPAWRPRLLPGGVVGRAALSNYLFQTILCTTIFFGYGGGLYAKVHLAWLLVLSLVVFVIEVPASQWWLARHRFGPAEWAWRAMTYGSM